MPAIKIMTWNVKGTGNQIKRRRLELKIKRDLPDILFLQETHQKSEDSNRMYIKGMQIYEKSFGTSKSRGVATLISDRIFFEKEKVIVDDGGRYVIIVGNINEEKVTLVNLYLPNEKQKEFLEKVTKILEIECVGKVIVAGDFNLIRDKIDSTNPTRCGGVNKMGILSKWMLQNGLVDVWREVKGNERVYTFYSKIYNTYSRIDYILISKDLLNNVDKIDVGIFKDSDHAEVMMELDVNFEKKRGCWRYDEKLYKNDEDKKWIFKKWEESWRLNDNGEVKFEIVWDTMKAVFRGESIKLSSRKYRDYKNKIEKDKNQIKELEKQFLLTKGKKVLEELNFLKNKSIEEDTELVKKNIRYLNRNFFEYSNKNSKLLARMAKNKKEKREIGALIDDKGIRCYKKLEKCEVVRNFFQNLYAKKLIDQEKLRNHLEKHVLKIDQTYKDLMEEDITQEEINGVIQKLKLGKTPGEDGLPAEFYKEFKEIIIPKLQKLFNGILQGGEVPTSWNRTVISLIPKPDKDLERIESYRPISLINQDAKIFTTIISNRLSRFIDRYISYNQVGFVKGRYMSDIVRRVLNIIDVAEYSGDKIGIVSLDIFKAFDSVQWETIKVIIEVLGFGNKFIHVISKLYQKSSARVKVNGMLTEEIKLEAGTRQGCPLSPTLFLLVMEILTKMIEKDEELEGYKGYKINLYADDTLIILKDIEKDLKKIYKYLKEFEEMTGLKVNWSKSELLMDNEGKEWEKQEFGIRIKNTLKYLGITLSLKVKEMKKLNYDVVMNEVEKKIDKYKKINLSWFGRIAMCKMMLLPKYNFLFEMLPLNLTEKEIEGYQKKLDKFCNGGKKTRLVKKMWYQNQKEGGLGIPKLLNYYYAYGIRTVVKIFKGEDRHWRDLELKDVKRFGPTWFLTKIKLKYAINSYWLKGLNKIWNKFVKILVPDIIFLGKTIENWPIKSNINRDKVIENENIEIIIDWLKILENEERKNEIIGKLELNWFEKIQIEKWIKQIRESSMISRNKTEFEYLVSQIMKDEIGIKGLVSKIYKIINFDGKTQMAMKTNWEKDLNIKISDSDWNVNWKSRIMKILSVRIKEHNYKVVWKWYLTPLRLSLIDNKTSKKCWRCDKELGTYEHMWYKCDKIKIFWQQLEKMIVEMMGKTITLSSELILLLIIKETELTKYEKELIRIIIIIGRIIIARYWKLDVYFKIEEWYNEIWKLALNDKMTCSIKIKEGVYKEDIFWKTWKPFVDYALEKTDILVSVPRERGFWQL